MSHDLLHDAVSRRVFLARMSAAGLGTAAAALLAGCGGSSNNNGSGGGNPGTTTGLTTFADKANFPGIPGPNENVVVLNFALTLELLEADLYRQALNIAAGQPITAPLPANSASAYTLAVSPGSLNAQDRPQVRLPVLAAISLMSRPAHRDFLQTPLSRPWAAPPFRRTRRATAPPSAGLVPGASLSTILKVILTAEETGVSAYLGAAGFLKNQTLVEAASYDLLDRVASLGRHQPDIGQRLVGRNCGSRPVQRDRRHPAARSTAKIPSAAVDPLNAGPPLSFPAPPSSP